MKDIDRKKIEEILDGMICPKNFKCAGSGFENLCKARDIGNLYSRILNKALYQAAFPLRYEKAGTLRF
jgi:hypothetical protein